MKALDTFYDGHHFRSRLEARWAVFFKTLGIPYEYEKEGFDLDGECYLPDFWLPNQQIWFEVKGQCPTTEEYTKAYLLCRHSGLRVCMAIGEIKADERHDLDGIGSEWTSIYTYDPTDIDMMQNHVYPTCPLSAWTECQHCNRLDITFNGYTRYLSCHCFKNVTYEMMKSICETWSERLKNGSMTSVMRTHWNHVGYDSDQLLHAYTTARQARFEHGQKG